MKEKANFLVQSYSNTNNTANDDKNFFLDIKNNNLENNQQKSASSSVREVNALNDKYRVTYRRTEKLYNGGRGVNFDPIVIIM